METYQCGNDIRLSPSAAEVLDEGEGLGNLGHDGVEEPVVVIVDIGHRLRTIFISRFAALRGSVLAILMLGLVASSQEFWCWDWWPAHRNLVRCPLDFSALSPGLGALSPGLRCLDRAPSLIHFNKRCIIKSTRIEYPDVYWESAFNYASL